MTKLDPDILVVSSVLPTGDHGTACKVRVVRPFAAIGAIRIDLALVDVNGDYDMEWINGAVRTRLRPGGEIRFIEVPANLLAHGERLRRAARRARPHRLIIQEGA